VPHRRKVAEGFGREHHPLCSVQFGKSSIHRGLTLQHTRAAKFALFNCFCMCFDHCAVAKRGPNGARP
jgi:hypothetical protein